MQNGLPILIELIFLTISLISPGLIPKDTQEIIEKFFLQQKPDVIGTSTEVVEGMVARVIDGDTIVLENGETVRYIGIDAPETSRGRECFADESTNYNKLLVEGKVVRLEKDVSERDRYGRLLRYVYVNDEMVNRKLVLDGYAFAASYPPDIKNQEIFKLSETEARKNIKGLWATCVRSN